MCTISVPVTQQRDVFVPWSVVVRGHFQGQETLVNGTQGGVQAVPGLG